MSEVIGARLRWELLHLAVAAMEAAWVYVWLRALDPPGGPLLGFIWLLLFAFGMVSWNRVLLVSERWEDRRRLMSLVVALVGVLLTVQLAYVPDLGLLSGGDYAEIFLAPWHVVTGTLTPLTVAGAMLLVLWFRTIHITQEPLTFYFTAYRFRLGVLLVIGGLFVAGARGVSVPTAAVFLYFGVGLLAIALARAEQVTGTATRANELPFTSQWAGMLAGVLALTLSAAWLVAQGFAFDALERFAALLSPVTALVQRLVFYVGLVIFYLLTPFINAFISYLDSLDIEPPEFNNESEPLLDPNRQPQEPILNLGDNAIFAVLADLLPILVVVAILLLIVWQLRRDQGQRETAEPATRESVAVDRDGSRFNVSDLLARGRDGLNALWQRVGMRGWFGTETVEDLYRNLLLWGAHHGMPRAPDETPYEYMETLGKALTQRHEAVKQLTDAYVNTRYGSESVSSEELSRLKDAWRRLRGGTDEGELPDETV